MGENYNVSCVQELPCAKLYREAAIDKPNYMVLSATAEFAVAARLEAAGYKVYKPFSQKQGPDLLVYSISDGTILSCSVSCVPNKSWPSSRKVRNIAKTSKREASFYVYYDISKDFAYVFLKSEMEKLPRSFSLEDIQEEEWSKLYVGF